MIFNSKRRWRLRALVAALLLANVSPLFATGGGSYCCSWQMYCTSITPMRDLTECSSAVYHTIFYYCDNYPGCGYYGGNLMCGIYCP